MGFALPRISWGERAPEQPDPPGVVPLKLPQAIDAIGWAFTWGCIGFLLYFTWASASDHAVALQINQFLGWQNLGLKLWLPLVIPYTVISIAVPILVKYGLPMFMEFDDKKPGQSFPKWWTFVLILGGSLVIIAGSVVVQNDARVEMNRGGAVRVEQVNQNRAALQANLDSINADLKDITNPALTTYQAQAAREGAEAWAKRVATAKAQNDYQADAIERALAAAERGDQLRKDRAAAIQALAAAPTQASAVERVVKQGDSATAFADFIKEWRSVLLAIISDLGAVFCTWLALRLMALRTQQLADWHAVHSDPIPAAGIDTLAIEDQTDTWQVQPQDVQYDEDGNELVKVRRKKEEYYRRKSTPKKKQKDDPRAAQMFDGLPEDGQNPQSEVSDGTGSDLLDMGSGVQPDGVSDIQESNSGNDGGDSVYRSGSTGVAGADEYADSMGSDAGGHDSSFGDEANPGLDVERDRSLTHAQEDQQAEPELQSEEELRALDVATEAGEGGFDRDESGLELLHDSEAGLADDGSETLLPNNEGVLIHDEDEDLERRAAKEAAE